MRRRKNDAPKGRRQLDPRGLSRPAEMPLALCAPVADRIRNRSLALPVPSAGQEKSGRCIQLEGQKTVSDSTPVSPPQKVPLHLAAHVDAHLFAGGGTLLACC